MLLVQVWLLPESPRWLAKKGKEEEARQVLGRLRAHGDAYDPMVERELLEMRHTIELTEQGGRLTAKELFTNGPTMNLYRLCLAVGAQAMQQIGGINLVRLHAISFPHTPDLKLTGPV